MPFKKSYLTLRQPSYLAEQNHLGNLGRGHYEEHFCEIILHLDQWFRRYFLSRALVGILFGAFRQFKQRALWRTVLWNYFEFGPVVKKMALQILKLMHMYHKKVTDIKIFSESIFGDNCYDKMFQVWCFSCADPGIFVRRVIVFRPVKFKFKPHSASLSTLAAVRSKTLVLLLFIHCLLLFPLGLCIVCSVLILYM